MRVAAPLPQGAAFRLHFVYETTVLRVITTLRECGCYLPLLFYGDLVRAAAAKYEIDATMLEPKPLACGRGGAPELICIDVY